MTGFLNGLAQMMIRAGSAAVAVVFTVSNRTTDVSTGSETRTTDASTGGETRTVNQ